MKQALVVIDVQNDYFPGGAMELVGMEAAALNCQRLLENFRDRNEPIFHIQHIMTREGASFFIPDTIGCEIHETVKPLEREVMIVKHFPSCFRKTELSDTLKDAQIDELIICGAMTHMCIDTSTRAAFDLGYSCVVIHDACTTKDLEFNNHRVRADEVQTSFMAALSVPFAKIVSTQEYINMIR